jgi:lambda family phage tail tape measure protein
MANMDALLRIRADVQGANGIVALGRSLQGVERAATTASVAMRGVQSAVGGLVGLVGGVTIITKIFGDTATLQTQTRSLEVLLGSASKAGQIIKELQAYGSVTPFESTELIETAKRLGAFGVVGQRVVEVTKRLGDIAGATGANLGELATAYGQVVSKGRLQTEELLQFQERGVGIQAELQKMYGLSGQELQKALSAGRVSSEAFEQAIIRLTEKGGKYANGAVAQSDTLTGRLSTLKDTVTSLSQTIGAVLEPAINRILLIATSTVDTINRAMRAAVMGPQNAETIAQVNAGQLPFGTTGVDKLIGEKQRKALQGQAAGFLGLMDNDKFLKLLQQQPEFRSPAGIGGRTTPLVVPPLTPGTNAAAGGGRAGGAGSKSQSPAAQIAMALKSALGITEAQAAGIAGNLMRESGLNPRVNEGGAIGAPRGVGGYGLAQWTGTRQTDLVRFAGGRGQAGDMATQLRFMVSELMGPESKALAQLKTAQSPEQAAYLFDKFYERSGVKAMGERQGNARKVFSEIAGSGPAAGLADFAQGEDAKAKAAVAAREQAAQQLTAARDLLATKEAAFEIANAITPLEKLSLEFDNERTRRMQEYVDKLSGAKSDEERLLLVQSQAFDIRKAEIDAQEKMKAITADQLGLERERATLLADSMARMEEMSTRSSIGTGAQQGLQGYVDSVGNLRDAVGQLTTNAIGGLEDSLTSLATTGAGNFKAFAASVLQDVTRMIIRQLVLKSIMQIIGGIGGGGVAQSFEMPSSAFIPSGGYAFAPSALGNVFAANGIQPFAQGGIVSRPTLFPFAKGIGLMGEAGPEAIMPLRRGADGKLGVAGGGGSTTINVSVDAKGSSVQGDSGQGGALARVIAGAVQNELVKQRRPGGLLAS